MAKTTGIELEKSLLGLIIEEPRLWDKTKSYITLEDFSDVKTKLVFNAMLALHDKGYEVNDISSLTSYLENDGSLMKIGGVEFLEELVSSAAYGSNFDAIIKDINLASRIRRIKEALSSAAKKLAVSTDYIEDNIEQIERDILVATRDEKLSDFVSIKDVVSKAQEELNLKLAGSQPTGLLTGYPQLDKQLGGMQPGNLVILAARPGEGKTTFAINIATNVANKKNVAFFSLEMSSIEIINRIVSAKSLIEASYIKNPKELDAKKQAIVNNAFEKISNINFFIDDSATIRLSDLVWKAKKLHKNNKLDLLVVDYLQLLTFSKQKSENRQNEVSAISRALKQLARELGIPIIALSQLSRRIEQRTDKRPLLSDLRESGSIEQDADIIMFINKEYLEEEEFKESHGQIPVDIIVAKHRNGSTGSVKLSFKPSILTFYDGGNN